MNELVPDKMAYQVNKRRMSWTALLMMCATTAATAAQGRAGRG